MNICYAITVPERRIAMYRKIMSFLKEWKESGHRKPLILQGARQVGKTYSILEFGRNHYENVAYFNFETNPKLNKTFEENISPDYLIPILSHIAGQTMTTRTSSGACWTPTLRQRKKHSYRSQSKT